MTEQEAIDKLKKPPREAWKYGIADLKWDNALDIAIKALEKQIPKKPIVCNKKNEYEFYYTCPTCGSVNIIGEFCNDCFQRIDWSEQE